MSLDFQRLEQVLAEAAARADPAERAAFLDVACGEDRELRAEVERLLAASQQAGDFLETPVQMAAGPMRNAECGVQSADSAGGMEGPGSVIGRYKLLEEIGEGGFGVVYMAEQTEPVHRKVALKVVKAGMDTREVVARFEAERQALALMDHPNIARVFDGGVTQAGRPYFVMELVRGIPITEFCDQRKLSTSERLKLFIQVCHAVQHAHQKGIIHRDLKPSNILVTLIDGEPVPKVIDFGVAKALGQRLTDKTLFTGFLKMIGTPAYMSPEQADLSGVDIDTRADIYALGVLLYELLTGVTPFDGETLRNAALDEIRRLIRETEPPRPSTRLQTLVAADVRRLTSKSEADRASLRRLLQERKELINLVRGDLDWIVMKCLEKDRGQRYETANGLAADIERHLDHEPVTAAAPSTVYRARKFVGRHKVGLAVAGALVLLLAAGAIVSTWQAVRATRAERSESQLRHRAESEKARADEHAAEALKEKQMARYNLYVAHISLIQQELRNQRVGLALKLLDEQEPAGDEEDLRGFEWHYLRGQCQRGLRATLRGHSGPVTSVAFSPDGKTLVSGSSDGTVRLWEITARVEPTTLAQSRTPVRCVACSPDGKTVAWGRSDGTLIIWDVARRKERAGIQGHKGGVRSLAFSPDSRLMASVASDWMLGLWEAQTGNAAGPAMKLGYAANACAFSPDGRTLAANDSGAIRLYDVPSCRLRQVLRGHRFWLKCLAFAPDSKTLVSGGNNETIKFWDVTRGQEKTALEQEGVDVLSLSADGTRLAAGLDDGTVVLRDLGSGQKRLVGHADSVHSVAFSPKDDLLASASRDWTIKLWDATSSPDPLPNRKQEKLVWSIAFSPDGRLLASAGDKQSIRLWDVATGQVLTSIHPGGITVTFSPDGKTLAFVGFGGIALWDLVTGQLAKVLKGHPGEDTYALRFSPDGRTLASAAHDMAIILWDVASGQAKATLLGHTENFFLGSLAFSPDGAALASASGEGPAAGQLILWDVASGQRRAMLPGGTTGVEFSRDGKTLASVLLDGKVALWNPATGERQAVISGHVSCAGMLAFSSDGKTLISRNSEGSVSLWDLVHKQERAVLRKTGHSVYSVAVSPDGKTLATGGTEGKVEFWRADDDQENDPQSAAFQFRLRLSGELSRRGMLLQEEGQEEQAQDAYREAVAVYERLAAEFPERPEYRQGLAATYRQFIGLVAKRGQSDTEDYQRALALADKTIELAQHEELLAAEQAALCHEKGKLLDRAGQAAKALEAYSMAIELARANTNAPGLTLKGALLRRSELLRRMNRLTEAAADRRQAVDFPPRDPRADANLLDLSAFYNAGLKEKTDGVFVDNNLAELPTGIQTLNGTKFDIRGFIQVSRSLPAYPASVTDIPVGQVCERLHFLHAATHTTTDGRPIGRYLVRYANGQQQEIPILAGRDVADWWGQPNEAGKSLVVAWTGANAETRRRGSRIRLFETTWPNPQPDVAVQSLDFEALDNQASPFVVAITADRSRVLDIPPRDPRANANLVDLSLFYNAGLKENTTGDVPENNLAELPTGIQTLGGTQFDVRGLIQVSQSLPGFPASVTNIPVWQVCQSLHFLHAAFVCSAPDGRQIARYSVRYSNGQQREIPIRAGQDIADWWELTSEEGKPLVEAWRGLNGKSRRTNHRIRLFKTTWPNPQPDVLIQSIDFEALDEQAVPLVVAITAE